jgi:hypothetical protein
MKEFMIKTDGMGCKMYDVRFTLRLHGKGYHYEKAVFLTAEVIQRSRALEIASLEQSMMQNSQ